MPFIFYPCIPYERKEVPGAGNHYNCPMVTSYSENIKNNMEELKEKDVKFLNPFMAFTSEEILSKQLQEVFKKEFDIPESETKKAAKKAWDELAQARTDVEKKGEEVLQYLKDTGKHGIVLAGRPYHIDPEINHGIAGYDHLLWFRCPDGGLRIPFRKGGAPARSSPTSGCTTPASMRRRPL